MSNVINKKSIIAKTTGVPYVVGRDGDSAYEVAVKNGYTGTEQEWLASLKGATGEKGDDGFSPTVSTSAISGGHSVSITDSTGSHSFNVMDGEDGNDGDDGYSPTISVSDITGGHRLTITDAEGTRTVDVLNGSDSVSIRVSGGYIQYSSNQGSTWSNIIAVSELKGEKGDDGEDGVSPSISVASITGGHRITISFKGGLNVFNVMDGEDGEDGQDGQNGTNGQDGHSPVVTASKSGAVTTVSVDGTPIASINDGTNGTNGTNGQDGVSPTATVSKVGSVATISITDKNGTTTAAVSDGTNGVNGTTPNIDSSTKHWMIGSTDTGVVAEGQNGQNGEDGEDGKSAYQSAVDGGFVGTEAQFNTNLSQVGNKQDTIQFSSMPTASSSNVGQIVQYNGVSTQTYTNGYFYQCTLSEGAYAWLAISVQAGGGGGGMSASVSGTKLIFEAGASVSGNKLIL